MYMVVDQHSTCVKNEGLNHTSMLEYIEYHIKERAQTIITQPILDFLFTELKLTKFYMAGGSLYKGEIADIDIWTDKENEEIVDKFVGPIGSSKIVTSCDIPIQICKGGYLTLKALVDEFDLAHCQVGVSLKRGVGDLLGEPEGPLGHIQTYIHPNFIAAMTTQTTFVNPRCKWPLRSLARIPKIVKKLGLSVQEGRDLNNQLLAIIVSRGLEEVMDKEKEYSKILDEYSTIMGL